LREYFHVVKKVLATGTAKVPRRTCRTVPTPKPMTSTISPQSIRRNAKRITLYFEPHGSLVELFHMRANAQAIGFVGGLGFFAMAYRMRVLHSHDQVCFGSKPIAHP